MTARLIHFAGHVQGVGFRYTVKQLATGFEVTGSVKNLPDGRVELWVQGDDAEVGAFVGAIRESNLRHHIKDEQQQLVPTDPKAAGFHIAL